MRFRTERDPLLLGVVSIKTREKKERVSVKHVDLCNGRRMMKKLPFLVFW